MNAYDYYMYHKRTRDLAQSILTNTQCQDYQGGCSACPLGGMAKGTYWSACMTLLEIARQPGDTSPISEWEWSIDED